jgi:putative serine/threonine protein kinase
METAQTVLIERLKEEPYASVLCYPKASEAEVRKRLGELREHSVKALEFMGKASAFNVPVLGKGFVGIVAVAHLDRQKVALKIRRVDADRTGLQHEAQMLGKANAVQVGPNFMGVSKNFLLMQLIEGIVLPDWLDVNKGKARVRDVLNDVLEQCWRLEGAQAHNR